MGNDGLIGAQRRPSSSMGRTCEEWRCGDAAGQLPAEWFGPVALAAWSLLSGATVSRLGLAVPEFAGERAGLALHHGERCDLLVAVGWSGGLFGHRTGGE